jgi:magnesium and cobalt transporter
MTDEDSSSPQEKSWLGKLADAFSSDPQTRDDLAQILRAAYENKLIDNDALEIIEGALKVSDQQVREIMIPRSQMVLIRRSDSLETILSTVMESNHSRFPVVGESADDVRGILLAKELLPLVLEGRENFSLDNIIRPATIIPESKRLNVLLREFREQRYHMAIVVDEYGGVAGLVTIEDILEEIVGDIEDETDAEETRMIRKQDNGHYLIEALTPIEHFNEFFDVGLSDDDFDTIGGLIVQAFGRLPEVGETVDVEDFVFRVSQGDNRQVKLLELLSENTPES